MNTWAFKLWKQAFKYSNAFCFPLNLDFLFYHQSNSSDVIHRWHVNEKLFKAIKVLLNGSSVNWVSMYRN